MSKPKPQHDEARAGTMAGDLRPAPVKGGTVAQCPPGVVTRRLDECVGARVKCPACTKPADVFHSRGGGLGARPIIGKFWMRLNCTGCGSRLERSSQMAEVISEIKPAPKPRPLGQVVSHMIKCPLENCGQTSKAVWTIDDGHVIDCPLHGRRKVEPDTLVELVA